MFVEHLESVVHTGKQHNYMDIAQTTPGAQRRLADLYIFIRSPD